MRKGNYAANVKENVPRLLTIDTKYPHFCQLPPGLRLDEITRCGIIILAISIHPSGGLCEEQQRSRTGQRRALAQRRNPQPNPRESPRCKVPGRRFFRPARPRPSQIRDVAPRLGRKRFDNPCCPGIRDLTAHLLSSQDKPGSAGTRRIGSEKRGPHGPHKLSAQIISFLKRQILPGQPIRARELVRLVRERFGLQVHPRTIERVLAEKKTPE